MIGAERLPALVLTGFLGSGKTTLLGRILADPQFSDSAVILNELGEVGLDQDLVTLSEDSTVVMPGGCVCCTVRGDIERALRDLFDARDAGRIQPFRKVIIETTGIADPLPLLFTLNASPLAAERLEKPRVVTIVDGVLGRETLASQPEAAAQVAAADLIVISKRDLEADPSLDAVLSRLNPWAPRRRADLLTDAVADLIAPPEGDVVTRHVGRFACLPAGDAGFSDGEAHGGVRSFCLVLDTPLDWTAFGIWMSMLLHRHGQQVLRVKGLLDVEGAGGPVVFHGAQHLVHPPIHLTQWPSEDHRSRLVFIVRGLTPESVEQSLRTFDSAAKLSQRDAGRGGYLPAGAGGTIAGRPVRRATAPRWMKG
ncbi:CobW family GTP-binding protein [Xanthobacter variabilis]|uniref:CobW family GTP-binding protein n=1 Tax=Xanthobacter variabilis TaxID=3119932 RepID=UPI00374EF719